MKDEELYILISEWLKKYQTTNDEQEKAKLKALIVTRMMPIVKRIARTIARRSYDPIDDLVQAGCIGMLKAIDSFSFEIQNTFKYYAGSLIIGEMKHYIRDKANTIRVPGHIQELAFRINSFISTLTVDELNDLTSEYVADALNVTRRDVDIAIQSERRRLIVSLDSMSPFGEGHNNLNYEEVLSSDKDKQYSNIEDARLILELAIARLPKENRKLIELYYYNDMSQKDIAEILNITPMMVHRHLKQSFDMLYNLIADSHMGDSLMEIFD